MPSAGPNVVLVLTDDQGYGDVACHGNPVLSTPHFDRLHDDAVRLTDFHVSPTCSPTRAALMTGRYNNRVGVWHTITGRSILPRGEVTMADVFAEHGYRTGMFGKWHLGDNHPYRPTDRGFTEAFVHGGGGIAQTPDYWGNDYVDDTYCRNGTYEPATGYCTDVWFDEAIDFVKRHQDQSFFCYVATNAPHAPLQVPDSYWRPYADEVPEDIARFYGMITNIDENLGRLRERLGALDLASETILIVLGDNGSANPYYNAGMRGAKGSPYDGGHRVPCFVHWPGQYEDRTVDRLSAHYDLFPTLIDSCGFAAPPIDFDGVSIRDALCDTPSEPPDRAIVVDSQRVETPVKWKDSAVCTERWRLVRGEELYDITDDPGQAHDVAAAHPAVVDRLRNRYEAWWRDIQPFPELPAIDIGDWDTPVRLTAHDWHDTDIVPWNQGHILEGLPANGAWAINVTKSGTYRFTLHRWPPESPTSVWGTPTEFNEMDYGTPGGNWTASAVAIEPTTARIEIANVERKRAVGPAEAGVTFDVELPAGRTTLRTTFEGSKDQRGAYYVTVAYR